MNPRVSKGLRWATAVFKLVSIVAGVKAVFAFGAPDPGKGLALALVLFVGFTVIICPIAFVCGWLTGPRTSTCT
jgi:hypothetical protein